MTSGYCSNAPLLPSHLSVCCLFMSVSLSTPAWYGDSSTLTYYAFYSPSFVIRKRTLPLERRTKIHHQGHCLAELPCPVPGPFCSFQLEWHKFILWDFHPACTAMAKRNLDQNSRQGITPFIKQELIRIDLGLSKMFFYNKVRKWSVWVNHIFLTTSYHLSYTYQTYFQRGRMKLHFCDFFPRFCLQFTLCFSLPCSALQDVKLYVVNSIAQAL